MADAKQWLLVIVPEDSNETALEIDVIILSCIAGDDQYILTFIQRRFSLTYDLRDLCHAPENGMH
jgi:hypothetical protein